MSAPQAAQARNASRAVWLKNLHQWHWISSALCLLGMLLFSVTGITLNHAAQIEAKPSVTRRQASLPAPLAATLTAYAAEHDGDRAALPAAAEQWLRDTWSLKAGGRPAEWSADEVYLPLAKAGGDAWVRIALPDGAAEYENTDRGWISWLNDVHKGRNTGPAWNWFIDIFAGTCLLFCLTGLLILKFHATNRPFTWPMVGLGILIPCAIALLFIH
ncbi:PepSY-associated TM helix domain-containing protein [Rugamonas sp. CCM 8940]|uniref:PepSY-associated TM helix domain-containing protein n=1 Tax=Rugamonas sp. CCM 8940 TaxID=2765359 RepID=UPI0018F5F820|nr:PepSY-associated TM helix domain-containing protein [Rugamonas sp. CCM 8940]MBJ7308596.1 PepSY-associated TM helix domain-containing protein [Rugamonas sp. CCM 8940]